MEWNETVVQTWRDADSRLNTTTVQIQSNLAAGDRTCERLGSDGLSDNPLNTLASRDGSDRVWWSDQ